MRRPPNNEHLVPSLSFDHFQHFFRLSFDLFAILKLDIQPKSTFLIVVSLIKTQCKTSIDSFSAVSAWNLILFSVSAAEWRDLGNNIRKTAWIDEETHFSATRRHRVRARRATQNLYTLHILLSLERKKKKQKKQKRAQWGAAGTQQSSPPLLLVKICKCTNSQPDPSSSTHFRTPKNRDFRPIFFLYFFCEFLKNFFENLEISPESSESMSNFTNKTRFSARNFCPKIAIFTYI